MKWLVYNLLFAAAFPFMLPGFLLRMLRRGGYRARFCDRFGLYPKVVKEAFAAGGDFVWVHAVSVGEVQVAGQLMREWRAAEPGVRFCFSTTSSTGWRMAEREVGARDVLVYNPLDFPNFVKSALAVVRPRAIVLTESEIWPVFIRRAQRLGVPVFLVNARVSDRSAPRYRAARWFFRDVFGAFARIFAQSALDRARLVAAGAPEGRVSVSGSFKFDVARRSPEKEAELRGWIGPGRILLGGSTWPGEDEALLKVYAALAAAHPDDAPVLVLAPRHFEKADAVEANIRRAGFACVRRSRGDRRPADGARAVFLADTTGELMGLYGIADAVFVGKTLTAHGGQNMIEPCLCGKPTVVGPHTENFRPVMSDLLEGGGIVQVKDFAELERTILGWFAEGDGGLGGRARAAVERRRGVVPRCVRAIAAAIPKAPPPQPGHGGGGVLKGLVATILFLAVLALACSLLRPPPAPPPKELFGAVRTVTAYIALLEKPDARTVLLADPQSEANYRAAFAHAGLSCQTGAVGRCDLVLTSARSARRLRQLAKDALSARGVIVCALDVQHMTARAFKAALEGFPGAEVHCWMPTETDWLLVGRLDGARTSLAEMMAVFDCPDAALEDLAAAETASLPELFASYVGTREEVMGAFAAGDLDVEVRPAFLVPAELPMLGWVVNDVDADIFESTGRDFDRVQTARRLILEGAMMAPARPDGAAGGFEPVLAKWKQALALNGHDPMILDRLHKLQICAWTMEKLGKFRSAASCYEMMLALRPRNDAAVRGYAQCLRQLGRRDDAEKVLETLKRSEP